MRNDHLCDALDGSFPLTRRKDRLKDKQGSLNKWFGIIRALHSGSFPQSSQVVAIIVAAMTSLSKDHESISALLGGVAGGGLIELHTTRVRKPSKGHVTDSKSMCNNPPTS